MTSFKTHSVPALKPPKMTGPKPQKLPGLKLPTMKSGAGPKPATPSIASVHGHASSGKPRGYSNALAKAASSSSATAGAPPAAGAGWRNQGRTRRPQQDSPFGFLGQ